MHGLHAKNNSQLSSSFESTCAKIGSKGRGKGRDRETERQRDRERKKERERERERALRAIIHGAT